MEDEAAPPPGPPPPVYDSGDQTPAFAEAPPPFPPVATFDDAAGLVIEDGSAPPDGGAVASPDVGAPLPAEDGMLHVQAQAPVAKGSGSNLRIIPLCRKGDRVGIERQIQAGVSIAEVDVEGNTPLHVAVEAPRNEIATVQCLLENGADPSSLNYIGAAPLHYVCLRKSNLRGVANILLENGANVNAQTIAGKSALHFACEQQLPEFIEMLCLFGAETNMLDSEGSTPMHLAMAREGGRDTVKRQIVDFLVQYQAGVAFADCRGMTPMHHACYRGHIRCVQGLLEHQADPQVVTAQGRSGIHLACEKGHSEVVQLVVQMWPHGVNLQDAEGNTALHLCALNGSLECAVSLLKADADVSIKNNQKRLALDMSKIQGTDLRSTHNPELVQVLKDAKKSGGCRQQ